MIQYADNFSIGFSRRNKAPANSLSNYFFWPGTSLPVLYSFYSEKASFQKIYTRKPIVIGLISQQSGSFFIGLDAKEILSRTEKQPDRPSFNLCPNYSVYTGSHKDFATILSPVYIPSSRPRRRLGPVLVTDFPPTPLELFHGQAGTVALKVLKNLKILENQTARCEHPSL